jgi:hypothetical protein
MLSQPTLFRSSSRAEGEGPLYPAPAKATLSPNRFLPKPLVRERASTSRVRPKRRSFRRCRSKRASSFTPELRSEPRHQISRPKLSVSRSAKRLFRSGDALEQQKVGFRPLISSANRRYAHGPISRTNSLSPQYPSSAANSIQVDRESVRQSTEGSQPPARTGAFWRRHRPSPTRSHIEQLKGGR